MRGLALSAMFLPFICLSAVNIGFGGSGHPRALLAVVLWPGGLFYGGMSLLCHAVDCALCAWFRWFPSFICHFIVVWRSPALRLLCAAVSALCPVVFDGGLRFSTFLC